MSTRPELALPVKELHLLQRGLPKWPQMYTTGTPISVSQAKDIIRRTDTFFLWGGSGNDEAYRRRVCETVNRPYHSYRDKDTVNWEDHWLQEQKWKSKWGTIETSYVSNSWVACAFVGGPHGWCHPDGAIGFVDNVGKWPDAISIYRDWARLAKEFPFLDIGVTLFDGESCEEGTRPVVSFKIQKGKVSVHDPETFDVHEGHPAATRSPESSGGNSPKEKEEELLRLFGSIENERGIPFSWIEEWRTFG